MRRFLVRTIGGLGFVGYFRHLLFGLIFFGMVYYDNSQRIYKLDWVGYVYMVASTVLYPYSRFLYERLVGFVIGDNFFIVNSSLQLFIKFLSMGFCWILAIPMAPLGLVLLFFLSDPDSY